MKKVTTIIGAVCMMGLLTFVSTSCKKNQETGDSTISVVIPDVEEEIFDGERAYLTVGNQFRWSKDDQVRVYNLAEEANAGESTTSVFHKVGTQQNASATFQGPSVGAKKALGYRIFYPTNMIFGDDEYVEDMLHAGNQQTFVVSEKQYYSYFVDEQHQKSLIDPAAMPMAVETDNLYASGIRLHHMFGFLKFVCQADEGEVVVVDSIKLVENDMNLTGKVTLNLGNVNTGELETTWDAFETTYHGAYDQYLTGALATELGKLGWLPEATGKEIMLDCIYEHEGGAMVGETLNTGMAYTYFTFVVRPTACWSGFSLVLYIHDNDNPTVPIKAVINRWNGNYQEDGAIYLHADDDANYHNNPNYQWGMKHGKVKTFTFPNVLSQAVLHPSK